MECSQLISLDDRVGGLGWGLAHQLVDVGLLVIIRPESVDEDTDCSICDWFSLDRSE